jgi:probable rRNA maturation factor
MVLNRQRAVRVSISTLTAFLARARRALRLKGSECAVCLVSDQEMARLNRTFRGKSGPTDVLSFPADQPQVRARRISASRFPDLLTSRHRYLGDIAIAPGVARRNARRSGRTLEAELRILVLHGILHLLGYDHESDNGEMKRLEGRLRRRLGLEGNSQLRAGK